MKAFLILTDFHTKKVRYVNVNQIISFSGRPDWDGTEITIPTQLERIQVDETPEEVATRLEQLWKNP